MTQNEEKEETVTPYCKNCLPIQFGLSNLLLIGGNFYFESI